MKNAILQITSGKGPAECERAVALALREIMREAREAGLFASVIADKKGQEQATLISATVKIEGKNTDSFVQSWTGVLLWICQSPFRKFHKRKNWFIGVNLIDQSKLPQWKESDLEFKTMRSSGPGGQHVNKTESAVRATHVPSGLFVTASDSRSQLQNKKLAIERLKTLFLDWSMEHLKHEVQKEWLNHHQLERGNPKRIYSGREFELQK